MFRKLLIAAAGAAVLVATPVIAQPVAVVVQIKTPASITRPALEDAFRKAAPDYQKIPGLIRKYFTIQSGSFGGIYLWKDQASAEQWFSVAWRARAKATYGSDPQVLYFDAPVVIEGTNIGRMP